MQLYRSWLTIALFLLGMVGAMAAPVDITIQWLPPSTGVYDISGKATAAVAQAFMARYPNIRLHPFSFLQPPKGTESSGGETNILMAMAGGVAPDVLTVNFRSSETFISQGFLYPMDKFVDEWQRTPAGRAELARIIPSQELWHVIRRPGPDGKAHVWAIPPIIFVNDFWYRKDLLRNAGYDPNQPPRTWDEFYHMSLRITDPRKGQYGFACLKSYWLTPFIWSAGSDVITRNATTGEWSAAYATEGAVTACQFYWKMIRQPWGICPQCGDHFEFDPLTRTGTCAHGHHYTEDDLAAKKLFFQGIGSPPDSDAWSTGKQAFTLGYMGDVSLNLYGADPNLVGVAPMPLGPTGLRGNELNSSMLGINGTVKDPAKIAAAWQYIRFAASEEAKRIQTQVMVEGGFAKYVNPIWLRQFGYTAYLRDVPPGWEGTYRAALASGHPEPYGKNAQQIYNEMDLAWDKIALLDHPDHDAILGLLRENAARTNERLFGHVSTVDLARRNRVATFVVLGCALLFAFLIRLTLRTYGDAALPATASRIARRRALVAWLVLAPALIGVVLFQYFPLARGSVMAFQNYSLFGARPFVGMTNFGAVLFAPEFWHALWISTQYAAMFLVFGFITPVLLALLLHEAPRGSLLYRIIFFLPAITSGVVIMLLWKQLYDPTPYGMLNQVFALFHINTQSFLQDPKLALFWVILPGIWAGLGPGSIIYLAAMKQIPEEYYEAADIDGAGFLAKFFTITLPFLKPLLIINLVGACVGAFKSFEPVWIMTSGGPAGKTDVLGLEIWRNAFMYLKYSYATAMGWMLAALLIGFTIFQLQYLSKVQFRLAKSD